MSDLNDQTGNISIHDEVSDAAVTTTTVGSRTQLDVNSNSDPTTFKLKTDFDATGVSVTTSVDVELFAFTGAGVLDFVDITNSTSSNYEVIINVDGVERIRITMSELGSDFGITSGGEGPMWAATANKIFRYRPDGGVGFGTSFSIEAKATTGTQTLKHFVLYREQG